MRSPIWYFGGKGNMVRKLLPLFPPHRTYVEPFAGGASMFFAKPPSNVEVLNDLDGDLVNFYRIIRDPETFEEFRRMVELTPYSRQEFLAAKWMRCESEDQDPIKRAWAWWVTQRQGMSGWGIRGWSFAVTSTARGMAQTTSKYLGAIAGIPEVHNRLKRVQIEHNDFKKILKTYDTDQTLFYCDPPYPASTRKDGGYTHEMTDEDHADLVKLMLESKGMFILSCYNHEVYIPLLEQGYHTLHFKTACYAAVKSKASGLQGDGAATTKVPRTETVYISPNCGVAKQKKLFVMD